MGQGTDAEIIARSLEEPDRFEKVFDRHYDAVRLFAQRLAGIPDGEEIAAETFVVAFTNRARFDGTRYSTARPWLIGIAHNLARHHFRSERLRREAVLRLPAAVAEPEGFRAEAEDARRLLPAIRSALLRLNDEDRETFLIFALAEISYEEVAEAIGIPSGTVRSRIHRARRILREQLEALEAIMQGRE